MISIPSAALRALTTLAAGLCMAGASHAQAKFPERSVSVIVPFAAGAAADSAMRVVAKKLSEQWGQPVVVEARPGAAGMVGGAQARPDGYLLTLGAGSGIVTSPLVNPKLAYKPDQFVALGRMTKNESVIVVNPKSGIRTLAELIAKARANPGKLNFGSSGPGAPNHLSMELFQQITGTQMVHVPYKGAAPLMVDLVAGQIDLSMNTVATTVGYIKSGKLTALAVASDNRVAALPDVPTTGEAGVKSFNQDAWYGLFAPAQTPKAVVDKISADLGVALRDPEVVRALRDQGNEAAPLYGPELQKFIEEERASWVQVIRERKLKLEE